VRGHRADRDLVAIDLDALQFSNAAQIDEAAGGQQPEAQRRQHRLAAGQDAVVAVRPE